MSSTPTSNPPIYAMSSTSTDNPSTYAMSLGSSSIGTGRPHLGAEQLAILGREAIATRNPSIDTMSSIFTNNPSTGTVPTTITDNASMDTPLSTSINPMSSTPIGTVTSSEEACRPEIEEAKRGLSEEECPLCEDGVPLNAISPEDTRRLGEMMKRQAISAHDRGDISLWHTPHCADVRVKCRDRTWHLHRDILCRESNVFKSLLSPPDPDGRDVHLDCSNWCPVQLAYSLYYMYNKCAISRMTRPTSPTDGEAIRRAVFVYIAGASVDCKGMMETALTSLSASTWLLRRWFHHTPPRVTKHAPLASLYGPLEDAIKMVLDQGSRPIMFRLRAMMAHFMDMTLFHLVGHPEFFNNVLVRRWGHYILPNLINDAHFFARCGILDRLFDMQQEPNGLRRVEVLLEIMAKVDPDTTPTRPPSTGGETMSASLATPSAAAAATTLSTTTTTPTSPSQPHPNRNNHEDNTEGSLKKKTDASTQETKKPEQQTQPPDLPKTPPRRTPTETSLRSPTVPIISPVESESRPLSPRGRGYMDLLKGVLIRTVNAVNAAGEAFFMAPGGRGLAPAQGV
ncbi:hypothetical protein VTJ49DRAFT_747 [Mycothermus thermophilus]|uniref:BTB domain-containing protein n=1 Tax=Humicola insolens TaxID=85995 RepID=A0ABR3VE82_HUMIN